MSLHVDSFLRAIDKANKEYNYPDHVAEYLSASIDRSTKFIIQDIDILEDDGIVDYGCELLQSGLLRIPYASCYFEFQISVDNGSHVDAVLLTEEKNRTYVLCSAFSAEVDDRGIATNCTLPYCATGWRIDRIAPCGESNALSFNRDDAPDDVWRDQMCAAQSAMAALALMDLKEARLHDVTIPDGVRRHRAKKNRPPLYDHKVLTITPEARHLINERQQQNAGNPSLIKRRAHWRRGHLRHLPDRIVPVRPALVRGEGFVSKDYKLTG